MTQVKLDCKYETPIQSAPHLFNNPLVKEPQVLSFGATNAVHIAFESPIRSIHGDTNDDRYLRHDGHVQFGVGRIVQSLSFHGRRWCVCAGRYCCCGRHIRWSSLIDPAHRFIVLMAPGLMQLIPRLCIACQERKMNNRNVAILSNRHDFFIIDIDETIYGSLEFR